MKKLSSLLLLALLIGCTSPTVTINDITVKVELAQTPEEQQKGLMFREALGAKEGMLFIFDGNGPRSFWMKNTLIPLDMIFIAANKTVMNIETALPCDNDPCPTYNGFGAYVLEVQGGFAEQHNIIPGAFATIE